MVLAVHEAVANAVRHSGSGDSRRSELDFHGDDLWVTVTDRGCGFTRALSTRAGRPTRSAGGRGLYLMCAT